MRKLSLPLALLALALLPGLAVASHEDAPSGNSAVDEYFEERPGGSGGKDGGGPANFSGAPFVDTSAGPGSGSGGGGASFAGTGGSPSGSSPGSGGEFAGGTPGSSNETSSGSDGDGWSLSDFARTAFGGDSEGGLGIVLPIILGAVLVTTVLLLLAARRRRGKRQIEQA